MSTENDDLRVLAGADRYPAGAVAELDLDGAREALRREITATPRPVRPGSDTGYDTGAGRRRRWLPAVAAAAAVAAVATGGLVLRDGNHAQESPAGPASPAAPKTSNPPTTTPPADKPATDPGLPPTFRTLRQVLLEAPGWTVSHLTNDPQHGGDVAWQNGQQELGLTWYPAANYASYLHDRQEISAPRDVEALGQLGQGFTYPAYDVPRQGGEDQEISPTGGADPDGPANDPSIPDLHRMQVLFPPVGDWFLEVDVSVLDSADLVPLVQQLRRVDRATWLEHLDVDGTVLPAGVTVFLAEAGRGVPMPPGVDVTADDLDLPKDDYQARVAYVVPVMCGWARAYIDASTAGDAAAEQEAITALEGSADWPVMRAMDRDGDFPDVFAATVDDLVHGTGPVEDRVDLADDWGCR